MANFVNNEQMFYDISKHRYILTPEDIQEVYGISLDSVLDSDGIMDPERLPSMFLERVSKMLYTYMYSWAKDREKTEYVVSLPKYREGIKEAMEEYAYSLLLNNTDPSIFFTGNSLKAVEVPPNVQTILLNNGLIFRGEFFNLPQDWEQGKGTEY